MPTQHTQEALRRIFVYKFMRPDDFAWAPIDFPGIQYDDDGMLGDGMQAKATAHLIDAIRQQGYELAFDDPATDPAAAMNHILWDKWTEDEIGEYQFIGRLFNERGQIYRGCNIESASYPLTMCAERVAIFTAIAAGATPRRIAVSCLRGDPNDPNSLMPCGACRQVMMDQMDPDAPVLVDGVGEFTVAELLPKGFRLPVYNRSDR